MALAIFDLDNTLLAGDSDHRWGEFLCDVGLANAEAFSQKNDAFYADYQSGQLDMTAYLDFVLEPLTGMARSAVRSLQRQFVAECIEPMLLDKAFDLLNEHRIKGDTLLMMTATHAVVAEPVAARLVDLAVLALDVTLAHVDRHLLVDLVDLERLAERDRLAADPRVERRREEGAAQADEDGVRHNHLR